MRNIPDLHDMENERTMPEITSDYDLEKDAQNRRQAKNKFSNGKKYEEMEPHELEILDKIRGIPFEESKKILIPYLSARYERLKNTIDEKVKNMKIVLDKQKKTYFRKYGEINEKANLFR